MSFAAAGGDLVEVRGPNGSGKTTLLRALAGFFRPQAGRIVFEGVEEAVLALHHVGHLNALKGAASVRAHVRYWAGLVGVARRDGARYRYALRGWTVLDTVSCVARLRVSI